MPIKVLVVDDEPDIVDTAVMVLTLAGLDARGVYSGEEAVRAAAADPPDAVVFDLAMPGMSGVRLAHELRRLPLPRRPLLVAVSAYSDDGRRRQAIDAGADEYLVKPADPVALAELLTVRAARPAGDRA